jgi:1-acyl-sn-glycerol-3-phosphate acyltransferase
MNSLQRLVYYPIRTASRTLCRVHDEELEKIPQTGPLILVANHVNFLDVPVFYTHLIPRPVTGFVKSENWSHPILGPLFILGEAIPVKRGEVDRAAIDNALAALRAGKILAIAPEGTRSGDGRLRRARPGLSVLARASGAPVLPVVYFGGEKFYKNIARLRRTDFYFRVGSQYRLNGDDMEINRETRQQITDEMMYRIAAMLPESYRGYYADSTKATEKYWHPA